MDESIRTAIRCFKENLGDFGDPRSDPEKYNLYNGLANLAEAIAVLQSEVNQLRAAVEFMKQQMPRR